MGFLRNLFGSSGKPKPGKVITVYDDTFEAEVLRNNLPVVVDFWASWCMPCQVMSGLMSELAKEYADKIKVAKMNVDQCMNTAQAFGICSIPTVIFFSNGKVVDQVVGLMPKGDLIRRFDRLIQ